jgi:hypothetical protein
MSEDVTTHRLDNGLWVAWQGKEPMHGSPEPLGVRFTDRTNLLVDEAGVEGSFRGDGLLAISPDHVISIRVVTHHRDFGDCKVSWAGKVPTGGRDSRRVVFGDDTEVELATDGSLRFAFFGLGLLVLERTTRTAAPTRDSLTARIAGFGPIFTRQPVGVGAGV